MRIVAGALLLVGTSTAAADPAAEAETHDVELALAANQPFTWAEAASVGVSGYIGLAGHHAIRANVATHRAGLMHGINTLIGDVFFGGDGSETSYDGRTTDVGLSYQCYPLALFSGLFFEGGVMRRAFDEKVIDWSDDTSQTSTGTAYAGRAHVGWSWSVGGHGFVAAAVGMSVGRYVGVQTDRGSDPSYSGTAMTTTTTFNHVLVGGEAYLRFGVRVGL